MCSNTKTRSYSFLSFESNEGILNVCNDFCAEFGWDNYNIYYSENENLKYPIKTSLSNYPREYFQIYERDKLFIVDPVAAYCRQNISPIFWDQLFCLKGSLSADCQPYFNLNRSFNLNFGVSIPIRTPNNGIGIFNLARKDALTKGSDIYDSIFHAWTILSNAIDYLMLKSSKQKSQAVKLTKREKECLSYLCEGKSSKQTSCLLGISERTVLFHINGATKKLGASNRQHTIAIAILNGHVSI